MVERPFWGEGESAPQPHQQQHGDQSSYGNPPQDYSPSPSYSAYPATPASFNSTLPPTETQQYPEYPQSSQYGNEGQQSYYDQEPPSRDQSYYNQQPPAHDHSRSQNEQRSYGANTDYYQNQSYPTPAAESYGHNNAAYPQAPYPYQQSAPEHYHQRQDERHGDANAYGSSGDPTSAFPPSGSGYPNQDYGTYGQAPPGDNERGFTGAVAGAALGAYGGHKVHHGFLGAIAGGVAGSKLQDHLKDKKKQDKQKHDAKPVPVPVPIPGAGHGHGRRDSSSSSSSSSSSDSDSDEKPVFMAGNFSGSSTQITLDRDYDLIASCRTAGGQMRLSSISLNNHLTNDWGKLRWMPNGNFAATSKDIHLADGGKVLVATLGDGHGGWKKQRIYLDERISNNDGNLIYLG